MDADKLSPAPWHVERKVHTVGAVRYGVVHLVMDGYAVNFATTTPETLPLHGADAEFCALARNAYDVMLRRGWYPHPSGDQWYVPLALREMTQEQYQNGGREALYQPTPFQALVAADAWVRGQEGGGE